METSMHIVALLIHKYSDWLPDIFTARTSAVFAPSTPTW